MIEKQLTRRPTSLGLKLGLLGLLASLPYCATGSNLSVDPGSTEESSGGDSYAEGGDGNTPQPASGGSPVSPSGGSGPGEGGSPSMGGAPETGGTPTGGTAPTCTECPSGCVELMTDPANCGACDNACVEGDACYSGTCSPACPGEGQQRCGGSCVDTTTSLYNCGECLKECTGGMICVASNCTCEAGQTDCSGTCVNLQTDIAHCGTCETDCAGAPCLGGQCCTPPKTDCSGTCVDTSSDVNHCGGCDTPCTTGESCSGSACVTGTGGTGSGGAPGVGGSSTGGGSNLLSCDGTSGPCAGVSCASCAQFSTTNFSSGNLGTSASCYETTAAISLGNCGSFVAPRTLTINGTDMGCSVSGNWTSLPAKVNGGYCFVITDGQEAWAYFGTW